MREEEEEEDCSRAAGPPTGTREVGGNSGCVRESIALEFKASGILVVLVVMLVVSGVVRLVATVALSKRVDAVGVVAMDVPLDFVVSLVAAATEEERRDACFTGGKRCAKWIKDVVEKSIWRAQTGRPSSGCCSATSTM